MRIFLTFIRYPITVKCCFSRFRDLYLFSWSSWHAACFAQGSTRTFRSKRKGGNRVKNKVAIIGVGTQGSMIAFRNAVYGKEVTAYSRNLSSRERCAERIERFRSSTFRLVA